MKEGKGSFLKRHAVFELLLVHLDGDVQRQCGPGDNEI